MMITIKTRKKHVEPIEEERIQKNLIDDAVQRVVEGAIAQKAGRLKIVGGSTSVIKNASRRIPQ